MITIRRSAERGGGDFGWLNTKFTFSFDQYYDPRFMGFRSLRVINEDRVQAGHGFPMHPHRDMEIITYLLEGALEHQDSMGNGSIIRPGDGQRMSAGSGVRHSEANPSKSDEAHLLQIWILPDRKGHTPGYEQKAFPEAEKRGKLRLIASPDGQDGSSPAAGAVADHKTLERARVLNLDPAQFSLRSDSYGFFRALGDSVETGPTGNNLRDLRVLLAE